jgi:hypothetical protein
MQCSQALLDFAGFEHDASLLVSQRQGGITQMAGNPDIITRPGAAAA